MVNNSNDETHFIPILSFNSKILKEDLERQLNVKETTEIIPQTSQSIDKNNVLKPIESAHISNDSQKTNIPTKYTSSVGHARPINIINRNIQRCAVSRRISTGKGTEELHTISSTSKSEVSITDRRISCIKSKNTIRNIQSVTNTSLMARPLRAFHMSTMITNESSPKSARKSSSIPRYHHRLPIPKTFASRTILTTILPSSTLLKNQKNH